MCGICPSSNAKGSATIPFDYHRELIWIEVTINGKGGLNFLFDSGAEQSGIDTRTAKKLGITFVGSEIVQRVNGDEVAYQAQEVNLQVHNQLTWSASLLALNLRHESRVLRRRVDGLLGMDFMAGKVIRIDYDSKCMVVGAKVVTKGRTMIPIQLNRGNPCVTLTVDDRYELPRVRIDTGCNQSLQWSTIIPPESGQGSSKATIGSWMKRARTQKNGIVLGTQRIDAVSTSYHRRPIFPNEQGLLGNGLLSRFGTITLDFARKYLVLGER